MDVFSRRNFDGASIDEIAAAAGVTKPVLYDHFRSKEDLYIQVSKEIRGRLLSAGQQTIFPVQGLRARIRAAVDAFFAFAERNPAAIRILLSPPRSHQRLYRAVQVIQDEATASIREMMLAAGLPRPSQEVASQQLTVQVEFIKRGLHALGQWRIEHPHVSRETLVEAVSKLICSGLT